MLSLMKSKFEKNQLYLHINITVIFTQQLSKKQEISLNLQNVPKF